MTTNEKPAPPQSRPSPNNTDTASLAANRDIAPDVNCPHCGWVILCPHCPPGVPYPPHCTTPPPPRVEFERTDNFLENVRRHKAAS